MSACGTCGAPLSEQQLSLGRCPHCGEAPQGSGRATQADTVAPDPAAEDLATEPVLGERIGPYLIGRALGRGGMGRVFMASQIDGQGEDVAIKVLYARLGQREHFVRRFQREGQALRRLSHENIVRLIDQGYDEESGCYWLAMEYEGDQTLRHHLKGVLSVEEILRLFESIVQGVAYAHGRGVIHRDLKPSNIIITPGGVARILDFGIAVLADTANPSAARATRFTYTKMGLGTPYYMAPEQLLDPAGVDERADLYSLGVLLYEMLVGEPPVGAFDPPGNSRTDVPSGVDELVGQLLRRSPEERPPSAEALLELLASLGAETDRGGSPPIPTTTRGNAGWVAAAALAALLSWQLLQPEARTPASVETVQSNPEPPPPQPQPPIEGADIADEIETVVPALPDDTDNSPRTPGTSDMTTNSRDVPTIPPTSSARPDTRTEPPVGEPPPEGEESNPQDSEENANFESPGAEQPDAEEPLGVLGAMGGENLGRSDLTSRALSWAGRATAPDGNEQLSELPSYPRVQLLRPTYLVHPRSGSRFGPAEGEIELLEENRADGFLLVRWSGQRGLVAPERVSRPGPDNEQP